MSFDIRIYFKMDNILFPVFSSPFLFVKINFLRQYDVSTVAIARPLTLERCCRWRI